MYLKNIWQTFAANASIGDSILWSGRYAFDSAELILFRIQIAFPENNCELLAWFLI